MHKAHLIIQPPVRSSAARGSIPENSLWDPGEGTLLEGLSPASPIPTAGALGDVPASRKPLQVTSQCLFSCWKGPASFFNVAAGCFSKLMPNRAFSGRISCLCSSLETLTGQTNSPQQQSQAGVSLREGKSPLLLPAPTSLLDRAFLGDNCGALAVPDPAAHELWVPRGWATPECLMEKKRVLFL